MASKADVEAGRAFVRLFLKNDMSRQLVKTLRAAQAKLRSFGQSAVGMGRNLAMAGTAALVPFALSVRTFVGFEDQMKAVQAVTGATGDEFQRLYDLAKKLGASTSFTAGEVGGAEVSLGRAGFTPKEIENATGATLDLARATGTELPRAAEIAAGTLRAFNLDASEMGRVADVMTATANNSAQTLEELGESMKYAAPVAQEFGMSLEAMGEMSSLERIALGKELFGARAVSGALKLARSDFPALSDAIDDAAGTAKKTADMMDSGLGGAFRILRSAVEGVQIAIGESLKPTLSRIVKSMTKAAQSAIEWIKINKDIVVAMAATGAGLIAAGAALIGIGLAAQIAAFVIGGLATAVIAFTLPLRLLSKVVRTVGAVLKFALGSALSVVRGAFSITAKIISGTFTAALWGLKKILSIVTIGFHAMVSAVTIGINVITGLSGVISSLIALGPVAIVAALAGAFIAAFFAAKKLVHVLTAASKGIASGFGRAKQAVAGVGEAAANAGAKIRDGIVAGVDAAKLALGKLIEDGKAGFRHLVADIGGSWQTLRDLIAAGDMAEAWGLTLSIIKLEWVRFKQWLLKLWEGIKPTIDIAITNVADSLGNILANLKIAWGDIWDGLQSGLKAFLHVLDKAMDSARKYIAMTQAFLNNLPGANSEVREKARKKAFDSIERKPGESWEQSRNRRGQGKDEGDLDYINRKAQEAVDRLIDTSSGPPLETLVPGPRTEEEKKKEDEAAREQGRRVAGGIKGTLIAGEKTPAEKAAEAQARKEELASALKAHAAALASAKEAAARAKAARKEKEKAEIEAAKKATGGAGGPSAVPGAAGVPASRGVALTATYSAAAARISGFQPGGGPDEKMAAGIEKVSTNTERMVAKQDEQILQNKASQQQMEQFLAGWRVA